MVEAMAKIEIMQEGRLKRWSRLKRDSAAEETAFEPETPAPIIETDEAEEREDGYGAPDPNAMPGGSAIRRGATVPAMPSLITEKLEDNELEPALGVGEVEIEERDLTPEEQEIVSQLPPIESLTKDSDYTQFLSEKVPEFIRKRALTVLWRSDPVLANLDGLNDYDENFRLIDTLISAAKDTVYRVGKGHLKNEEIEANSELETQDDEETEAESGLDPDVPPKKLAQNDKPPGNDESNEGLIADANKESNKELEKKETEVFISSSIRKPKNSV